MNVRKNTYKIIIYAVFILAAFAIFYFMPKASVSTVNDIQSFNPNAVVLKDGFWLLPNVTYCNGQILSIFYPSNYSTTNDIYPVLVSVHGGGWENGNGNTTKAGNATLMDAGYAVVNVDYRLASYTDNGPVNQFPDQIIDVKCAVRFLRAFSSQLRLNGNKVGAFGGSSGGHLVDLLALAPNKWNVGQYLNYSSSVDSVVDQFGPANLSNSGFVHLHEFLFYTVFGSNVPSNSLLYNASPLNYVTTNDPPFLIQQGLNDSIVPYNQSVELYNALIAKGNTAQLVLVKNAGHNFVPVNTSQPIVPNKTVIDQQELSFFLQYNNITSSTTTSTTSSTSTSTSSKSSSSTTSTGSTTTSTTSSATTTTSGGGGNGGGGGTGGGGAGGGGSSKPVITPAPNGYAINNIAKFNSFNVTFNGFTINVTDNFITPNSTGVTVNGNGYTLSPNTTYNISSVNGTQIYMKLINISYVPIEQTISISIFEEMAVNTTSSTTSSTSSTSSGSSSAASSLSSSINPQRSSLTVSTTIRQQPSNSPNYYPYYIAAIVIIVIVVLFLLWHRRNNIPMAPEE